MKILIQIVSIVIVVAMSHISSAQNTVFEGNVGIGDQDPLRALHIFGTGGINDDVIIQSAGNGASQLNFWRSQGTLTNPIRLFTPNSLIGETSWRAWNGTGWSVAAELEVRGFMDDGTQFADADFVFRLGSSDDGVDDVMILEGDGGIKVPGLGTPGKTKTLEVLPDGTIQPKDIGGFSGIQSISAFDFISRHNPGDDHNYNNTLEIAYHESIGGTDVEQLIAPVHLPDGSIIKKIVVYYVDNHADSIHATLNEFPKDLSIAPGNYFIGATDSFDPGVLFMERSNFSVVVDNVFYDYYIYAWNPDNITDWSGGDKIGIRSVTIFYD